MQGYSNLLYGRGSRVSFRDLQESWADKESIGSAA